MSQTSVLHLSRIRSLEQGINANPYFASYRERWYRKRVSCVNVGLNYNNNIRKMKSQSSLIESCPWVSLYKHIVKFKIESYSFNRISFDSIALAGGKKAQLFFYCSSNHIIMIIPLQSS